MNPFSSRRFGRLVVVGWALIGISSAFASVDALFRLKPSDRMYTILTEPEWRGMDTIPVMKRLDSVAVRAQMEKDQYLYWFVQFIKVSHRQSVVPIPAYRQQVMAAAVPYFDSCPILAVQAMFWHRYGEILIRYQQFEKGFRNLLRADQAFQQLGYATIPGICCYLNEVGMIYYRFEDYQTAIRYFTQAEIYQHPAFQHVRLANLNACGMAYQRAGQYKQAERLFRKTASLAHQLQDTDYMGIASGNLGNTLRLESRFQEAFPYLYADLKLNQQTVPENSAITCVYIAKALLGLDSVAKAKYYLDISTRISPRYYHTNYLLNYYEGMALYARKTSSFKDALRWSDSAQLYRDNYRATFNKNIIIATENSLNAQRYLSGLYTIELEKTQAIWFRNLIIVGLILFFLAGLYIFLLKRQQLLEEKRRLAAQHQQAVSQLSLYLAHIHEKNNLIEKITEELTQLKQQQSEESQLQIDHNRDQLLNSVILSEKDWQQFKHLFEQVYPQFFDALQRIHPNLELTPAEIRMLALLKLDISTKEMAFMLGVSMDAIRKSRHRLRKKLEQRQADTSLEGLLKQL